MCTNPNIKIPALNGSGTGSSACSVAPSRVFVVGAGGAAPERCHSFLSQSFMVSSLKVLRSEDLWGKLGREVGVSFLDSLLAS